MLTILIGWSNQTSWLLFALPPFGLWITAGVGLLGFLPVVRRFPSDRNLAQIAKFGLERAFLYKWELLFTALSLSILTYIYNILLVLGSALLPAFPDILASTIGLVFLLLVFFAKLGKIAQQPPSNSLLKSVKYIYGEFSNPFEEYGTYRVLGEVNNEQFSDER